MTIEIHNPEIERIVNEAVLSGRYGTPQDVVSEAVFVWRGQRSAAREPEKAVDGKRHPGKSRFLEVCAMVRGLTDDADFSRDPLAESPS